MNEAIQTLETAYANIPRTLEYLPLRVYVRHATQFLENPDYEKEVEFFRVCSELKTEAVRRHVEQQLEAGAKNIHIDPEFFT